MAPPPIFAAIADSVAHGWRDNVQQLREIDADSAALGVTGSSSREAEFQADRIGGVWTQSADPGGLYEPEQIEGVLIEPPITGDAPAALAPSSHAFYDVQHGSGSRRTWWFLRAWYAGREACFG